MQEAADATGRAKDSLGGLSDALIGVGDAQDRTREATKERVIAEKALRGLETGLTGFNEVEIAGAGEGDDDRVAGRLRATLGDRGGHGRDDLQRQVDRDHDDRTRDIGQQEERADDQCDRRQAVGRIRSGRGVGHQDFSGSRRKRRSTAVTKPPRAISSAPRLA